MAQTAKPSDTAVAGKWEGESICTVPDSPCHSEHVVYDIVGDSKDAAKYVISAYKIVKGEQQFMGDIQCTYHPAESRLSCFYKAGQDDWEFTIKDRVMTGTLMVQGGKTLYRRIRVERPAK